MILVKHVERPYCILNSISRKTVSSSSKTILAPTSIFSKFVWIIFKWILKVIWIRVKYISRNLKQNYTTLNYTLHDITALCSNMTSRKKKRRCHRKWGDSFKVFWGRYSRCIVTQLQKSKGNSNYHVRPTVLWY